MITKTDAKAESRLHTEKQRYRLTGITPMLGSQPANPNMREQYIASKAPTDALREEENALKYDEGDAGVTVFLRDADDQLCLMDYHLKGYFKEALGATKAQAKLLNHKSKVDTLLFVEPRYIPILRDGKPMRDEDEMKQRSLRAMTMQGPRCSIMSSEMVLDPWEIEIEITILENEGTAKGKALRWDEVELALDYGELRGLGQWRNGGYGKFRWTRIDA